MSKLEDLYHAANAIEFDGWDDDIKGLIMSMVGEPEARETTDMTLGSWTPEDYKVFGKNELIVELKNKIEAL